MLEGGGVKGIGLVGAVRALEDAGYRWRRIAGTSAGSVVGALLAAGYGARDLEALMPQLSLSEFRDESLLDRFGLFGKGLSLLFEKGVYEGERLRKWLAERLAERGVRTFADLRYTGDAGSALPEHLSYRLVVTASDVSRGRLVRLPWDYPAYGLDPDEQEVAAAVRASVSIPFFYEPVVVKGPALPHPLFLVDGGLLSNFPITIFDRRDAQPPRWPTFGVKLSALPDAAQVPRPIDDTLDFGRAIVSTLLTAHDAMHLEDPCIVTRTVFVDTGKVSATDFDLDAGTQRMLFDNGRAAAERFLSGWDFESYVSRCRA